MSQGSMVMVMGKGVGIRHSRFS